MPDRYWVGGTGSWDGTAGTKWAATSGGPGGASVPTTADDVFFDANSNTGSPITVTIAAGNTGARSINCTGFTRTITGSAAITVAGSVTLVAAMTYTHTGTMTISGTSTLITAGKTFSAVTVNGAGITVDLGDALTVSTNNAVTVTSGTFNTNNFNVSAASFLSTNSNGRTINLGSSTITVNNSSTTVWDFTTSTNLTFNAGTSLINNIGNSGTRFFGGSQTFNNVTFASTAQTSITAQITGSNTFANLTLSAPNAPALMAFSFAGNQVITGTLTCAGATSIRRTYIRSDVIGTTRTLTVGTLSANDCDFRDIALAGAAAPASPTRAGDCGGNSGITFPAAKTVYRVGTNTTWQGSSSWALTSGGTGDNNNFPLAQDTAVIDNSTALTGTLSINEGITTYNISALDASLRTNSITFAYAIANTLYGSHALGSGVTVSGSQTQTFSGRGTMNFTSAGKTITFRITVDTPSGTFRFLDAFTGSDTFTLTRGTFDLNNFTATSSIFTSSNTNTRTLAFGTGSITVTGAGVTAFDTTTSTGLTVTGTPVVNISVNSASATSVQFGTPNEANSINFNFTTGTYSLSVTGNARNVNFTGFAGTLTDNTRTLFGDLTLSTGMTIAGGLNAITFASTSATPRTITTNGKIINFPLIFNGVGGTFQLLDALTMMGSARTLTHTNGTLDLNGFSLTVATSYATAAGTKNLIFNGGTLTCPAATTTAFNNAQPANYTTTAGTGTGTIRMTAATAKTFVGGGSTYNCTLSNDGAGALTITGSNTFTTLANGVQPTSFLFTAGTTTTLTNWNISGTAGNLVTIGSPTAASHTLSKASGVVNADYLSISRSNATGGATWNPGTNSVDGGNNTGWLFPGALGTNNFFLFFG